MVVRIWDIGLYRFVGWMDGWMGMAGWKKISDETFIKSLLVTSWQGVVAEHLAKFFFGFKDLEIFGPKFFFTLSKWSNFQIKHY